MITITPITTNHTPALKIPAIASQLLRVIAIKNIENRTVLRLNLFIIIFLKGLLLFFQEVYSILTLRNNFFSMRLKLSITIKNFPANSI